jgi:hypothetical protein
MKYTIDEAQIALEKFEWLLDTDIIVTDAYTNEAVYIFEIEPIVYQNKKIVRLEFRHMLIDDILNGATEKQLKNQLEVCCKTSAD